MNNNNTLANSNDNLVYSQINLTYMRQFYLSFPIRHALRDKLAWTHYRLIMKVENETARNFYMDECLKSNWSTRQLERQINTHFYERLHKLMHQDLGQMQMYVNYYTREMMNEGNNPPIGIILCADKSNAVVRYTLAEDNKQIFASKYMLCLPTEQELKNEIYAVVNTQKESK